MALNLRVIKFLSFIRSKILRLNFEEIEDQVNANEQEITNLAASTSTSEIISARDGYDTLQNRLHAGFKHVGQGVVTINKLISSCDDSSGWTAGTGATALDFDTSEKVEGSASLKMGKSTTTADEVEYIFDLADQSFEGKNITLSIFIKDLTAFNKLSNLYLDLTPDASFATNYKRFDLSAYTTKWNKFAVQANAPTSITGTVGNDDSIQLLRVVIKTNNITDVLTSGDLLLDDIFTNGEELRIREAATPDMTVRVNAGGWLVNGYAQLQATDTTITGFIAPSSNPRYDLIVANRNGDILAYQGTEAAQPTEPKVPFNAIRLARIYQRVGSTSIKNTDDSTNSFIEDLRNLLVDPEYMSNNFEIILGVENIFPTMTYNSDNTINVISYRIGGSSGPIMATATHSYTSGNLTSVVTVMGAVTYTTTFTYNASNQLINKIIIKS